MGVIIAAVGNTFIEQWIPPWHKTLDACDATPNFRALPYAFGGASACFNATISPFVPMRLAGFVVWLGESYVFASSQPRAVLGCLFKRFVTDLRLIFGLWSAYFGFVRLSSFCERGTNLSLPFLRHAQMQMLDLPNVGYAVAEDANSAPCDIHPSMANKRVVGTRLAGSALDILFGHDVPWRAPEFLSVDTLVCDTFGVSVRVDLRHVTGYIALRPNIECEREEARCHAATFALASGDSVSATILVLGPSSLLSRAHLSGTGTPRVLFYGWAAVPALVVYDAETALPLVPFRARIQTRDECAA